MSKNLPVPKTVYTGNRAMVEAFNHLIGDSVQDRESGSVESPSGWFAQFTFDDAERIAVPTDHNSHPGIEIPAGSFFLFQEDSQGFKYVYEYDTLGKANQAYEHLEKVYSRWLGTEEHPPSNYRIWIDMDSGTWGTSKVVGIPFSKIKELEESGELGEGFQSLDFMSDTEIINLGAEYGKEMV